MLRTKGLRGDSITEEHKKDPITEDRKLKTLRKTLKNKKGQLIWQNKPLRRNFNNKNQIFRQYKNMTHMDIIYFFQMAMLLVAYVGTFSEQVHFRRTHFFTASTSSEQLVLQQLLLPSNYFWRAVTFLEQQLFQICHFFSVFNFFQNSNFFGAKLLPSSYV